MKLVLVLLLTVFSVFHGLAQVPVNAAIQILKAEDARRYDAGLENLIIAGQITRDMVAMSAKINGELLKGKKNLKSETPTVNCTTCHRGQIKPATNLPTPPNA